MEEVAFTDPEFIASHIDDLRDNDGLEDSEIVDRIMALVMED